MEEARVAENDPHALDPGRNCWRIARATRATVIVDAEQYFRHVRSAMRQARQQILLVGWDFDARIKLVHEHDDDAPAEVGPFIDWLVARNPALQVHILRWDTGALKSFFQPTTLMTLIRWWRHPRIHVKLDAFHPAGASHHQKIVVIDDRLAFCGGIDMTVDRWDTRDHRDDEPRRREPDGTPYGPWHDATTALSGPVAGALGELCRDRWARAGGAPMAAPDTAEECWPKGLATMFTDADVAISRSSPTMPDLDAVTEIEALYVDLIARAERHVYAESQYFASRKVAEAIARRLDEPDPPEFVIINPVKADGWLEPIAMDTARARLFQALKQRDHANRLRIYHPVTTAGTPIYVHAKVTIIDDSVLRVGSSNFNNRSMRLDTECDVTIDATLPGNADEEATIAGIRNDLIAEHLGCDPVTVARTVMATGSLIATIDALRRPGRTLIDYEIPDLTAVEEWLADNKILDPEGPEEMFESLAKRDLLRRLRRRGRRRN